MILEDVLGLVFNQLTGFFIWLLITPLRLLIALFDPVLGPLMSVFNIQVFLDGFASLAPFFNDVNFFIPFFAAVAIIRASVDVWFVLTLAHGLGVHSMVAFRDIVLGILHSMIESVRDTVKRGLSALVSLFLG